ncbi:MAG: hypothetical protein AMXMBFR61_21140 [Fimbriimonadales bacterium]
MRSPRDLIIHIASQLASKRPEDPQGIADVEAARVVLASVNRYFYQTSSGLGATDVLDGERIQYFSEFHRWWEANHAAVLAIRIDRAQAAAAADALHKAVVEHGAEILGLTHQPHGLPPEAVAQVRFFTANQDWRESPSDPYGKYVEDPNWFLAESIREDPVGFVSHLGLTRLSQTDKRVDYARNAAEYLLANRVTAYNLPSLFGDDAVELRNGLAEARGTGYGMKKANMLVRDLVEMDVWPHLRNFEGIDVASDVNTVKVALRTRVLQPGIQLLSSFLDIFCYQYGHVDRMSAQAWRAVWEAWQDSHPETCPRSPCKLDFLLYRIGQEYCRDMLCRYECEAGCTFCHFGGALKHCRSCARGGRRSRVQVTARLLPCQVDPSELPRESGILLLQEGNLLRRFNGVCPFEPICEPKAHGFVALDPPKSISIKGQTGWTSSYADVERGGGGMMG